MDVVDTSTDSNIGNPNSNCQVCGRLFSGMYVLFDFELSI